MLKKAQGEDLEVFDKPMKEAITQLRGAPSTSVSDILEGKGVMDFTLKPLSEGANLIGPALTVELPVGDNLFLYKAMQSAKSGDVLVVNTSGNMVTAVWGELMTLAAMKLGLAGVVIDGLVRDAHPNKELRFPVFCKGVIPRRAQKKENGVINNPIICGGVVVKPGNVIIGDSDGLVSIEKEEAMELSTHLERSEERERKRKAEIEQGDIFPAWLERL